MASFNDWLPWQMKTLRTLYLERYGPTEDDDIPEHLFSFDDKVLLWANMVPPG